MNIILFGPPGSGKGTQGDKLVKEFNMYKVSAGDLLREESIKNGSTGNEIKSIIDKGSLVPDKLINNLIQNIVKNKKYANRLIFDGYPRNISQAKNLNIMIKENNQKISCVLSLKIDLDKVIKRILGRQICSSCGSIFNEFFYPATKQNHSCGDGFLQKRSDDNEKTIKNRFKTYVEETEDVLSYYRKQSLLHEFDGMRDISIIYKEICHIIHSLDT